MSRITTSAFLSLHDIEVEASNHAPKARNIVASRASQTMVYIHCHGLSTEEMIDLETHFKNKCGLHVLVTERSY